MEILAKKKEKLNEYLFCYTITSMNKIWAISDIHGCYKTLMALMEKLPINYDNDTVVFLGDYIDRGPRTKQVIVQLIKWEKKYPHWQFLYGNHEDLMLDTLVGRGEVYDSFYLWWNQGGKETTESYIPLKRTEYERAIMQPKETIGWRHIKWLLSRPRYFDSKDYFFVHAGIYPHFTIEEFKKQIDENNKDFKYDSVWIRDQFIDSDVNWGKKIIFGHTADSLGQYYNSNNEWGKNQKFMPIVKKNKIGLDCAVCPPACARLCAIELPSEKFYFQEYVD